MKAATKNPERSPLLDKNVLIRHATETDRVRIEESRDRFGLPEIDLREYGLVVALEDSDIIGIGGLRKIEGFPDTGCVVLAEKHRNRGVGAAIARHLIEYMPVSRVYGTAGIAKVFEVLGFVETPITPGERTALLNIECGIKAGRHAVLMVYERP